MAATLLKTADPKNSTPVTTDGRVNILGLSKKELKVELEKIGVEPKKLRMRSSQIFQWMYHHGVTDFSQCRPSLQSISR